MNQVSQVVIGPESVFPLWVNVQPAPLCLDKALGKRVKNFRYVYDFGDDWEHDVKVEKIEPATPEHLTPICLKGKRACPPEDCSGPWGYAELLEAIDNPTTERHKELLEWIGGPRAFNPEEFDLAFTNQSLANFRAVMN